MADKSPGDDFYLEQCDPPDDNLADPEAEAYFEVMSEKGDVAVATVVMKLECCEVWRLGKKIATVKNLLEVYTAVAKLEENTPI